VLRQAQLFPHFKVKCLSSLSAPSVMLSVFSLTKWQVSGKSCQVPEDEIPDRISQSVSFCPGVPEDLITVKSHSKWLVHCPGVPMEFHQTVSLNEVKGTCRALHTTDVAMQKYSCANRSLIPARRSMQAAPWQSVAAPWQCDEQCVRAVFVMSSVRAQCL